MNSTTLSFAMVLQASLKIIDFSTCKICTAFRLEVHSLQFKKNPTNKHIGAILR
jgi:hypothetical protein